MKYYDTEYRQELLSFLDGYKNILLYLKNKDEGIAEVLISDSLKKLEDHVKIITPGRFDFLSPDIKRLQEQQAKEYFSEQVEALKKEKQKEQQPQPESDGAANGKTVYDDIFAALDRLDQRLSEFMDDHKPMAAEQEKEPMAI